MKTEEIVDSIEESPIITSKGVPDIEVAKKMLNLKQSADSRNIKFDLSFLTLKKLMEQKRCFYTNINFEGKGDLALSIDRIDNKLGYIEGNVVACTVEMNRKKADITLEEIEMIYKAIKKVKKISPDKED
jgi:hypothetical protein